MDHQGAVYNHPTHRGVMDQQGLLYHPSPATATGRLDNYHQQEAFPLDLAQTITVSSSTNQDSPLNFCTRGRGDSHEVPTPPPRTDQSVFSCFHMLVDVAIQQLQELEKQKKSRTQSPMVTSSDMTVMSSDVMFNNNNNKHGAPDAMLNHITGPSQTISGPHHMHTTSFTPH